MFFLYRKWLDEHEPVITALTKILRILRDYDGLKCKESPYFGLIEPDETVFLLFFDN